MFGILYGSKNITFVSILCDYCWLNNYEVWKKMKLHEISVYFYYIEKVEKKDVYEKWDLYIHI